MLDSRMKVAAALMGLVVATLAGAQAHAAPTFVRYACEGHQNLVVERDRSSAHVTFIDRSYELKRARSSIGDKYLAPTAALIIDGKSAIFVAEDRLQLGACLEADPVEAQR